MLVQFTVGNYRSFSTPMTMSMEATAISDHIENVFVVGKTKLLTGAVLFGANSSGKTNFLRAIHQMQIILVDGFNASSTTKLPFEPFLKKVDSSMKPTLFEIVFIADGRRYRYGYEYTQDRVVGEWLFETEKRTEVPLFYRDIDSIEVKPRFKEGLQLEDKTRGNALFLSVVDQFNGQRARRIMNWFDNLNILDGISHARVRDFTDSQLQNPRTHALLENFYRKMDLGFDAIRVNEEEFELLKLKGQIPDEVFHQMVSELDGGKILSLKSTQKVFDEKGDFHGVVEFDVRSQESSGTNKLIDLSGPIFDTLENGGVLIVDELDAKLHPLLTLAIIRMFQNVELNHKGAQLIFATHDSNLLSYGNFRRDQIYFTEKDNYGASKLYSLVEYGGVRKDRSFEKDYLLGRYGAIPFVV
jgi:uncharacterized protein